MRQLTFAMRFTGSAQPASADGNVLKAATTAPSTTVASVIGPGGFWTRWTRGG